MTTLNGRYSNDITLSDATKNCATALSNNEPGIALLYSPTQCQFAKIQNDGTLTGIHEQTIELPDIFEARIFHKDSELRWLNELNGQGKAVLISELDISNFLECSIPPLINLETIPQKYILWGEPVETLSHPGWGKLAKSRIGSIYVPVAGLTANNRVYLTAIEYLQSDEEYGNFSVIEERLTALEVE